jgi:hypothetical protein
LRQTALLWWQNRLAPEAKLSLISKLFQEGGLVDDAAKMDAAVALVAARLPKTSFVKQEIAKALRTFDKNQPWGYYAKAWILSKYGTVDELMGLIEDNVSLWVTQPQLSRLTAGMFPRFIGSPHQAKFEAIIKRAGNAWSLLVLQFHLSLTSGTNGYTSIKHFVLAKNASLPNRISHAKLLMVLSLLSNKDLARLSQLKQKSLEYQGGTPKSFHYRAGAAA